MNESLLTVPQAAPILDTSPESLRRWIRDEGCPAVEGGPGRGRGYLVTVATVRAWRATRTAPGGEAQVRELAGIALDFWRRGGEIGESGQRVLGIPNAAAAALLCFFVSYFARRIGVGELRTDELDLLEKIALQGNVHGLNDSVLSRLSAPTEEKNAEL